MSKKPYFYCENCEHKVWRWFKHNEEKCMYEEKKPSIEEYVAKMKALGIKRLKEGDFEVELQ